MQDTLRIIDVRERFEFAKAHLTGSELVPLRTLSSACQVWQRDEPLLLVCRSGHRAKLAHRQLTALGFQQLRVLPGGIEAWIADGKPVDRLERSPDSSGRQIYALAALLVLLTLLVAFTVSRYALIASAFVCADLAIFVIAGHSMMASLLPRLPWNRPQPRAAADSRS